MCTAKGPQEHPRYKQKLLGDAVSSVWTFSSICFTRCHLILALLLRVCKGSGKYRDATLISFVLFAVFNKHGGGGVGGEGVVNMALCHSSQSLQA